MSEISSRLDAVILKTNKVLKQSDAYKKEADDLKSELFLLKTHIQNQEKTIESLHEKIKIIKLARSLENGEEKTDLKRKLNEYIKEIDRCVALLND